MSLPSGVRAASLPNNALMYSLEVEPFCDSAENRFAHCFSKAICLVALVNPLSICSSWLA